MKPSDQYFLPTYEEARRAFRKRSTDVAAVWPEASLTQYAVGKPENNNTTDIIAADAKYHSNTLIVVTTGVHGIEGYAGSALLQLFIDEYLTQLNPNTTGIRLVHAVNPWGMKNRRRVSENNVDLNRNFIKDWSSVPASLNERFEKEKKHFVPEGPVKSWKKQRRDLLGALGAKVFKRGVYGLEKAATMGQYQYPTGIFYGGAAYEEPVEKLLSRMDEWVKEYEAVVHIDIHTGLGPAEQLWLQVPHSDPRKEKELQKQFGHPEVNDVQKTDVMEIKGEDAEYVKDVYSRRHPDKYIFSCLLEFGTIGNRLPDQMRALDIVVHENQYYWYGAKKEADARELQKEFHQLFDPPEESWKQAVLKKGKAGFDLVLEKEAGMRLVKK
ncbi:Protein of unknown function [Marinococcus luteus]|uniref:Zinc carboxypeptidase n=1 Tax=Marinococcus luteus TaxID=1122204 RepID=A0A1H2UGR0_9BACI|nr:M14 family metallopeptidase [Marinococcus luteus]SDW54739.1 Protein of unknown function [Marinococcus luteus]